VEGSIKERLTGALILVALLVIVVPEMLSGPDEQHPARPAQPAQAGPPLRTYSLQLDSAGTPRSQDQSALSPKPADNASREQAAPSTPATAPSPTALPPTAPAPTAPPPTAPPATTSAPSSAQPVTAPSAASAVRVPPSGQWWAQLGSFASHDNAERLTRELRAAGYSVNLARVQAAGKQLYRVRAGPEPTREAATRLQARLAAAGHKSSLVAP